MIDEKKLIETFENIQRNDCKTLMEIVWFGGVLAIVESQPKVGEWIPIEVASPAECEHVQVSYIDYNTGKRLCDRIAYLYNGSWFWQDTDPEYGEPACVEITAWRTLGEPYMEEQKESDAA